MIEILEYASITDNFGNCYGLKSPSTKQIVDKINEIIDYINSKKMIFKVKRSSNLFENEESKETTEINTLEELQKFQEDCGHSIIINFKSKTIEIYDGYRE